jgi:oligopeptidase B
MKMNRRPEPPKAEKKPVKLVKHGDTRIDPYFWLRERDSRKVIDYLEAENRYFEQVTAPLKDFEKKLFTELKNRLKDEDESVPYRFMNYFYQIKYPAGKDFPVFIRWEANQPGKREILLDTNKRAEGREFYQPGSLKISPDDTLLAFSEDFQGRRLYEIRFKNLKTGKIYNEILTETTGSGTWADDNRSFFYVKKHPVTLRAYRLYKHILGTDPASDKLIYEETDEAFDIHVSKSKSLKIIYLEIAANSTTEVRYIDAAKPAENFKIFIPRQKNIEYYPYHVQNRDFFLVTNKDGATNFKILRGNPETGTWQTFLEHREDTLLEELEIFDNWLALTERHKGLTKIRLLSHDKKIDKYIDFPEETYTVSIGINAETNSRKLRYVYNSLTTPASVMETDFDTGATEILKEEEVADGRFDKNNYESIRLWAPGRDGTQIPVSLVWRKDMRQTGKNPLLLYGYGAYGITIDDNFSKNRLSLLDRGFIFAIAHVRGGEYLGRKWYENGKLLKKKNTFYDFIDVAEFLIREKYTSPGNLYAMGGSAGGLLIGAVINMRPGLFKGAVAQVPFVDVLTTMSDGSIPLTTGEYDEWGNPDEKIYYDYIKSYSPYDNITAQPYPHLLITAGYHDSQVQYWEPAKWAAKLREHNRSENLVLLYTDMKTGHGGASGRFKSLRDTARDFVFLLDLAGKTP